TFPALRRRATAQRQISWPPEQRVTRRQVDSLRLQCARQPCHAAPGSTAAITFTRPAWSSLITRATPDRPRAARPRRNASHPAPSPELVTAAPRISPHPPPSRPV